jgi:hypothetical protein
VEHRKDLHFLSTLSAKVRLFGLEMYMGYVRLTLWLDAVHDEGLKNLLMAWYYAGESPAPSLVAWDQINFL